MIKYRAETEISYVYISRDYRVYKSPCLYLVGGFYVSRFWSERGSTGIPWDRVAGL